LHTFLESIFEKWSTLAEMDKEIVLKFRKGNFSKYEVNNMHVTQMDGSATIDLEKYITAMFIWGGFSYEFKRISLIWRYSSSEY
jgi:precorrin-6B methylase 2